MQVDRWVPPYLSLATLALMWSIFLAFEIKVFTVSGTVAQVCGTHATPVSHSAQALSQLSA